SSCVVPMSRMEKREYAAYTIRPKIKRLLPQYLKAFAMPAVKRRWIGEVPQGHTEVARAGIAELVAGCEIDHMVKPSTSFQGGSGA
ncbi:hypothetical protein ABTN54_19885, partial [Acinetobacter baumannii]